MTYSAFNNDQSFKDQMVSFAEKHRIQDEFLKGTFGRYFGGKFQACSVGCSVRDLDPERSTDDLGDHAWLAEKLNVPEFIVYLQDRIFEGLPDPKHIEWTERLFKAIPLGADLSPVKDKFLIAIQERNLARIDKDEFPKVHSAIVQCIEYLKMEDKTEEAEEATRSAARVAACSTHATWSAARAAARSAVESAVESAAWSAERSAVESAAESAAWSAARSEVESAAESAAWSAARSAVRSAEYEFMADLLISLIEKC